MICEKHNIKKFVRSNGKLRCKPCDAEYHREWYKGNKALQVSRVKIRNTRVIKENQIKVLEYFEHHPCVDCKESDPVVLEFDHLGDKRMAVSLMIGRGHSWATIMAEIDKCEVRCANCHRRRTAKQRKYYRYKVV